MDNIENPDAFLVPADRWSNGMTLRDYLANSAMQGILSAESTTRGPNREDEIKAHCKEAYKIADEMLKQRKS